jgi:hypothetical protein
VLGQFDNRSGAIGLPKELGGEGTSRALRPALISVLEARYDSYGGEQERMEPLLVPRLPDPVACLDETKAANREFNYFVGVLTIRDSPCSCGHPLGASLLPMPLDLLVFISIHTRCTVYNNIIQCAICHSERAIAGKSLC